MSPDHSPTTQALGMFCHSDLRWLRSWDGCGERPLVLSTHWAPCPGGEAEVTGGEWQPRDFHPGPALFYLASGCQRPSLLSVAPHPAIRGGAPADGGQANPKPPPTSRRAVGGGEASRSHPVLGSSVLRKPQLKVNFGHLLRLNN